jgi:1,4-dihydroxy-2-naphthoate octaprenyltransferase
MSIPKAFFLMSRPSHLLLQSIVYACGVMIAGATSSTINPFSAIYGLITFLFIGASIHYANEYADVATDKITKRTPYSGGSGVLPNSGLPPKIALKAAQASLIIGCMFSLIGYQLKWMPLISVLVLAVGAFFGWMYSLPPLKLAWHGWGEVVNAWLGGIVLPVFAYSIQSGKVDWQVVLACLPFAVIVFMNLLESQWPDREADKLAGKRTLVTRLSSFHLRWIYCLSGIGYVLLILVLNQGILPAQVALVSLFILPLLVWGATRYTRKEMPFPTVTAMVVLIVLQTLAWGIIYWQ